MPPSCATFDENSVPPWTRGDFRGVFEHGNKPHPEAFGFSGGDFTRRWLPSLLRIEQRGPLAETALMETCPGLQVGFHPNPPTI